MRKSKLQIKKELKQKNKKELKQKKKEQKEKEKQKNSQIQEVSVLMMYYIHVLFPFTTRKSKYPVEVRIVLPQYGNPDRSRSIFRVPTLPGRMRIHFKKNHGIL